MPSAEDQSKSNRPTLSTAPTSSTLAWQLTSSCWHYQCDQRKPGCLRCEKSDKPCPGYRNLNEILFRDESVRIIRKAQRAEYPEPIVIVREGWDSPPNSSLSIDASTAISTRYTPAQCRIGISHRLLPPVKDLGANFFFANYTFNEPPFSADYFSWLTASYLDKAAGPTHVLRAAIDAVGLAGLSNVSHAPQIATQAKQHYCAALTYMKEALNDPVLAAEDTTFQAVILLGLFEVGVVPYREQFGSCASGNVFLTCR